MGHNEQNEEEDGGVNLKEHRTWNSAPMGEVFS